MPGQILLTHQTKEVEFIAATFPPRLTTEEGRAGRGNMRPEVIRALAHQ